MRDLFSMNKKERLFYNLTNALEDPEMDLEPQIKNSISVLLGKMEN